MLSLVLTIIFQVLSYDILCLGGILLVLGLIDRLSRSSVSVVVHLARRPKIVIAFFPWIPLLIWCTKRCARWEQKHHWVFLSFMGLVYVGSFVLIVQANENLSHLGAVFAAWATFIIQALFRPDGNDGRDDEDVPEGPAPTPTGDAVEQWLRSLIKEPVGTRLRAA